MNDERVAAVAQALTAVGYEDIIQFDRSEPEWDAIQTLYAEYDDATYIQLLVLLAATQDYQLNGDAQRFWRAFERVAVEHGSLN